MRPSVARATSGNHEGSRQDQHLVVAPRDAAQARCPPRRLLSFSQLPGISLACCIRHQYLCILDESRCRFLAYRPGIARNAKARISRKTHKVNQLTRAYPKAIVDPCVSRLTSLSDQRVRFFRRRSGKNSVRGKNDHSHTGVAGTCGYGCAITSSAPKPAHSRS